MFAFGAVPNRHDVSLVVSLDVQGVARVEGPDVSEDAVSFSLVLARSSSSG